LTLFSILNDLEKNDEIHLARILVLIKAYSGDENGPPVRGITKLVKLDFFLRYPVYLEKALKAINSKDTIQMLSYEQNNIESSMIRYHYGPWDHRYRRWINLLMSKGLIGVRMEKTTVVIQLTQEGNAKATQLLQESCFKQISDRSILLKTNFGKYTAMKLKEFVYTTFPEIRGKKLGEVILNEF
jgi:hypothetical protein